MKLHIILIMKRKMLCEVNQAISVEFTQNIGSTSHNIIAHIETLTEERRKEFAMYLRNNGGTI